MKTDSRATLRVSARLDLHVHSTASDGTYSPAELVQMAVARHLSALAITDHDTVAGSEVALELSKGMDLELIPGVEIGTVIESREVHLLGYFIDVRASCLRDALATLRDSRLDRAQQIIAKLNQLGSQISPEILSRTWEKGEVVGRPHLAQALVEEGFVSSIAEAFDRYLKPGALAYVPRYRMSPPGVLSLIQKAGGLAVLAHPVGVTQFLPALVEEGLAGLEVFYRGYTAGQISELLSLAHRFDLVPTGGTDFHGRDRADEVPPGSVFVPPDTVERLRERLKQGLLP